MSLLLGYNTNGFAHHSLNDALDAIASMGYRSVGLTLDVHHAPPWGTDFARLGAEIGARGLLPVVETGARFLLDPARKHYPTLMHPEGRQRRIDFYLACIDAAATLGAPCISLWSGPGDGEVAGMVDGLTIVCDRAAEAGVGVAFEPEPGMAVATMAQFEKLYAALPHPALGLTLDVGHLWCLEEEPPEVLIDRWAPLLHNVHLDDHRKGVHDHLFFGDGEIDFGPVLAALARAAAERDIPATVELSRHSHDAVNVARRAFEFLTSRAPASS